MKRNSRSISQRETMVSYRINIYFYLFGWNYVCYRSDVKDHRIPLLNTELAKRIEEHLRSKWQDHINNSFLSNDSKSLWKIIKGLSFLTYLAFYWSDVTYPTIPLLNTELAKRIFEFWRSKWHDHINNSFLSNDLKCLWKINKGISFLLIWLFTDPMLQVLESRSLTLN